MTLNEVFAIRVTDLLKEKKLSQYRLSKLTGIYPSTINAMLHNKVKASNFKNIALIIRELGVTMTEFFNSPVFNFDNLDID